MSTPVFKFLDICSYVSPGTSYEKWVKTYGAKLSKSWLPYEWFDCADKLDFEGLPPHRYWFPKQEKQFSLVVEGVWGLPASVPGTGNENVGWLAAFLQQPRCWALARRPGVHPRLLHWVGNPPFQRCVVVAGWLDEISPAGHAEPKRGP